MIEDFVQLYHESPVILSNLLELIGHIASDNDVKQAAVECNLTS